MFQTDAEFENEVRRIARLLWPAAEFDGAAIIDGRERDGVFETPEFVHIVECTTSRGLQKAVEDFAKLEKLSKRLAAKYPDKFVKGWFITEAEPTADQRGVFHKQKGKIVALSYDQFRSKLVDARTYLLARDKYAFGSVRDPQTGSELVELDYVPLDLVTSSGDVHTAEDIAAVIEAGRRVVVVGDYGAGKSSTVREIHRKLRGRFLSGKSSVFPITINLRDHHGQTDPVEALERHARRIGFPNPADLVRGWRSGLAVLLLDGFDEVAAAGWAGKTKRLKDLRRISMELIRAFVRESPRGKGLLLSGRAHFFDSEKEMKDSLGIDSAFECLTISEFSEAQLMQFLRQRGWTQQIPHWVPSRPLLLAYLVSRGLLQQTLEVDTGSGPAVGWNSLLDRIAAREAEIEAGIDAGTVRELIEHLASIARTSADGLGPLTPDQITAAFATICGHAPDDRGAVLLQRLPGLGGHSSEDGARVFIDKDFAEAARGGAVFRYIQNPFATKLNPENWQSSLSPLGAEVASVRCHDEGFTVGKIGAALEKAAARRGADTLAADVFLTLNHSNIDYDGPAVFLKDVLLPELTLENGHKGFNSIQMQDCIVGHLDVPPDLSLEGSPVFVRCFFGVIEGRTGMQDLPQATFVDATVDAFESDTSTTNDILALSLPIGSKVVLTILKKLYAQRGSGRKENALYRGLDLRARQLVPEALNLLRRENFISRTKQGDQIVWMPTKSADFRRRALGMIAAPSTSADPILQRSRDLD